MRSTGGSGLRHSLRLSSVVWLAGVGACTSIVGIEDLHEGPRPGTSAEGGDGTGGSVSMTTEPGGGSDSMPQAGTNEGGSAGSAGSTSIGGANEGGTDTGPVGGAGGDGNVQPGSPVHGTVVDFWGNKVPNVPVQIGDQLTSTDQDGKFSFDDVPAQYDVSFVTQYEFNTVPHTFAWVYQGLTRRDPTLSAISALGTRFGDVQIAAQAMPVGPNQSISVAIGGVNGNTDLRNLDGTLKNTSATWEGGPTTQATAHGLFFQYDAQTELPTSYLAYDSSLVALSENGTAKISLNLAKATVDSGALQGKVTPAHDTSRVNEVFAHFTSGATMTLVNDDKGGNTFTYLVPSLANATLTAQASEGDSYYGEYAVTRATGLTAASKPMLTIPIPATLTSPAEDITSNANTKFAFQSLASNPGPFVVQFEDVDLNGPFQTLYVVTAAKQLTIPEVIGGGFSLHADNVFQWRVATHGKFASVDAMAGSEGFLMPYDFGNTVPYGPRQGSGEYTISGFRNFKTPK